MNLQDRCLRINENIPDGGLYTGERREVHPNSKVPWRISPVPFPIPAEELVWLENLGTHLLKFYKVCNLLYSQSTRGIQPKWISDYLDKGKPETVIEFGRMRRFKSQLPQVIRPDILPTENGMVISELDSIPGGIGFTGGLSIQYSELGCEILGGSNGMATGFAEMVRSLSKKDRPVLAIIVSDEAEDYRQEMYWLASELNRLGLYARTVHPRDIIFTETGLFLDEDEGNIQVDIVYRFFELFDLKNIPKSELILYAAKKRNVIITPPPKAYLEEKLLFALFHHPVLQSFWKRELGKDTHRLLSEIIPSTWIIDPSELPPHAIIPGLSLDETPITDFRQLITVTQKQRELVIKPSGFSSLAWGSKGVAIGHDMATEDWKKAVEQALSRFEETPHILQEFHKSKRIVMPYYDFNSCDIRQMKGRALLRPYYFVVQDKVRLAGIQATVCPDDKKILHGMVDSVIVPCIVE